MNYPIEWGTSVDGIIIAIATVVLAYVTWRILKSTNKPEIFLGIRWEELARSQWGPEYSISIYAKNVGQHIAHRIKFKLKDSSFQAFGGRALEEIDFLNNGIDALAPEDERHERVVAGDKNLFQKGKKLLKKEYLQTKITVTYEGSMRRKYRESYVLDFGESTSYNPFE